MAEKKNKPEYQITWPEGAELKMDPKHLMEIRNSLETQFKLMIYKQPGFKFFPSLGNTNFFQHFRTNDGIDFGVCHLYWDKDATDNIDFIDENAFIKIKKSIIKKESKFNDVIFIIIIYMNINYNLICSP